MGMGFPETAHKADDSYRYDAALGVDRQLAREGLS
jgi:hypothetical protein